MVRSDQKGDMVGYVIEEGVGSILGVKADLITYYFQNNRFSRFEILWGYQKRFDLSQQLKKLGQDELRKNSVSFLGKPDKIDISGAYWWTGEKTGIKGLLSQVNSFPAKGEGYVMHLYVERVR
jgi:hypothetical protein